MVNIFWWCLLGFLPHPTLLLRLSTVVFLFVISSSLFLIFKFDFSSKFQSHNKTSHSYRALIFLTNAIASHFFIMIIFNSFSSISSVSLSFQSDVAVVLCFYKEVTMSFLFLFHMIRSSFIFRHFWEAVVGFLFWWGCYHCTCLCGLLKWLILPAMESRGVCQVYVMCSGVYSNAGWELQVTPIWAWCISYVHIYAFIPQCKLSL